MATGKRTRVYSGQPLEVRAAERRRAFVEAGIELIGTQGYRAATVRAVVAAAGFTDRYFYESFASTEALLIAVFEELSRRLSERVRAAIADAGPGHEARIEAGLGAFLEFMRDPRAARIVLMEVLGVSEAVTALYLGSTVAFATLLLDAIDPALLRDRDDRKLLGQALVGALVYAAGGWALAGYRSPASRVLSSCRTVLLGTLERLERERTAVWPGGGEQRT